MGSMVLRSGFAALAMLLGAASSAMALEDETLAKFYTGKTVTIADPELQADARKMNIEAVPTSGAELQQIIATMYATPPAIVARVKKGMGR